MTDHPICYLDAINAMAAIKTRAKDFRNQLVHLYCHNKMTITIFQAGYGRDPFIQACAQQIWLVCTSNDITMAGGHIAWELLISSADALSRWHMGQQYKDHVNMLIKDKGENIISVPPDAFVLCPSL